MNKTIIAVFVFWWFIGGMASTRPVQFGHFRTKQQCNIVRMKYISIMGAYATLCWSTGVRN